MDIQAPSPHDNGSSNSRRLGLWCSEAAIEYGLFTISHILTALQTCPGEFYSCIKKNQTKSTKSLNRNDTGLHGG